MLHSFDPAQAQAVGLRVGWLHYGLLMMISLTVVAALKAIGIILAIAFLVAPGGIAFLITRRFSTMLIVSVLVATFASLTGIYASFYIDSAPAPTIVLVMTILFILAFISANIRTRRISLSAQ